MAYDDDDDLFGEEFDFVDDDDAEEGSETEEEPKPKPRKRPAARAKGKAKPAGEKAKGEKSDKSDKADKPEKNSSRAPKRAKAAGDAAKREPRRDAEEAPQPAADPEPPVEAAPVGYIIDDLIDDDPLEEPSDVEAQQPAAPSGPPADHVIHIYEHGEFKRTIPRKFTDEQAVTFAEEYTRTNKAYGRYAIATPDDEVPSPTFEGAALQ